jgi:hypothetical protein
MYILNNLFLAFYGRENHILMSIYMVVGLKFILINAKSNVYIWYICIIRIKYMCICKNVYIATYVAIHAYM